MKRIVGSLSARFLRLSLQSILHEVAVIARQVLGNVAEAWLVSHAKVAEDGALLLRKVLLIRWQPLVRHCLAHNRRRGGAAGSRAADLTASSDWLG